MLPDTIVADELLQVEQRVTSRDEVKSEVNHHVSRIDEKADDFNHGKSAMTYQSEMD